MSDFSNRNRNAFEHSQKPEIITTNQKTNLSIHIEIENRTPSPESTTIFPSSICKKKVSSVIWCWRFKASSTLHNALTRNARRTVAGSGWVFVAFNAIFDALCDGKLAPINPFALCFAQQSAAGTTGAGRVGSGTVGTCFIRCFPEGVRVCGFGECWMYLNLWVVQFFWFDDLLEDLWIWCVECRDFNTDIIGVTGVTKLTVGRY